MQDPSSSQGGVDAAILAGRRAWLAAGRARCQLSRAQFGTRNGRAIWLLDALPSQTVFRRFGVLFLLSRESKASTAAFAVRRQGGGGRACAGGEALQRRQVPTFKSARLGRDAPTRSNANSPHPALNAVLLCTSLGNEPCADHHHFRLDSVLCVSNAGELPGSPVPTARSEAQQHRLVSSREPDRSGRLVSATRCPLQIAGSLDTESTFRAVTTALVRRAAAGWLTCRGFGQEACPDAQAQARRGRLSGSCRPTPVQ